MADTGRTAKTYDMYIDREATAAAITKGNLVSFTIGAATIKNTTGYTAHDDLAPYGVALETCTASAAAASGILTQWRGICYVTHAVDEDDVITKGELLVGGATAGSVVGGITSTNAEAYPNAIVGHALESVGSTDAEVLIMLKGW